MKIKNFMLLALAALAVEGQAFAADQNTNAPATNESIITTTNGAQVVVSVAVAPPASNAPAVAATNTNTVSITTPPATNAPATNLTDVTDFSNLTLTNAVRMNFHDAPLSTILKYLSARMGFVVTAEVDVRGNATIVSEQPVDKEEVIGLLSGALAKNGYSVSRSGRVLTITTVDNATTGSQTPVLQAAGPTNIPMTEEIATVILPVQTLNPVQLIKDLDQLIPPGAKVTANEAGNAVIMTARQKDIHRFSEIIKALDSSSVSEVRVFILNYADAKAVASELKEVFQSPDSSVAGSASRQQFRSRFFGGGGFPGGVGGDSGSSDSKNAANKAVFVSDDQRNAVVASAPPSYFQGITNVIEELDKPSEDVIEVHTFHLKYADAQETADQISNLFPDETKPSSDQNSSGRSYGFRLFTPPWAQQANSGGGNASERMKRQTTVRAVPDMRTHSVMVTASKDQLILITKIIDDLDSDPAMVQRVYNFDIDNADPATVQAVMTALFAGQNTRSQQGTSTSALSQRETSAAQQQTQQTTGFGSTGMGTSALH